MNFNTKTALTSKVKKKEKKKWLLLLDCIIDQQYHELHCPTQSRELNGLVSAVNLNTTASAKVKLQPKFSAAH